MPVDGQLTFHSETGTEGGYWALQDNAFIEIKASEWGHFAGAKVWAADDHSRTGVVAKSYHRDGRVLPDPMGNDQDYFASSHFRGGRGDPEADARMVQRWGQRARVTRGKHGGIMHVEGRGVYGVGEGELTVCVVKWDDQEGKEFVRSDELHVERWSYDGLHVLENGDYLIVHTADDEEIDWEGEIKLVEHPLFTESAGGMWIHADQEGLDREEWAKFFFERRQAILVPRGERGGDVRR